MVRDIFMYENTDILDETMYSSHDFKPRYAIRWNRVVVTLVLCTINVLQYWTFILGYKYASLAGVNNGILMSLYSIKSIFSSVCFYIFFKQSLKLFEIFGIAMCLACVICIAMSTDTDMEQALDFNLMMSLL